MGKKRSIKKVSAQWARRSKRKQLELEKEINNNKKKGNESPPERELVVILPDSENKSGPSGQEPVIKRSKRQAGEIVWDADHFPPSSKFQPPTKLPTTKSVIGRFRFLTMGGKHQMKREVAISQVALEERASTTMTLCTVCLSGL